MSITPESRFVWSDWHPQPEKRKPKHAKKVRSLGGPNSGRYPKGSGDDESKWEGVDRLKDDTGKPIVFYHGTYRPRDTFKGPNVYPGGTSIRAFYLTPSSQFASTVAGSNPGSTVQGFYVHAKNIFDPENPDHLAIAHQHDMLTEVKEAGRAVYHSLGVIEMNALYELGFDGHYEFEGQQSHNKNLAVYRADKQLEIAIGNPRLLGGPGSGRYPKGSGSDIKIPKEVPSYLHDLYRKARELKIGIHIYDGSNPETSGSYTAPYRTIEGGTTKDRVEIHLDRRKGQFWKDMQEEETPGQNIFTPDELSDRATLAHEIGHALYDRRIRDAVVSNYRGWGDDEEIKELPDAVRSVVRQTMELDAKRESTSDSYGKEFQAWRYSVMLDPEAVTRAHVDENLKTYAEGLGLSDADHQQALDVLMRYRHRYTGLEMFRELGGPGSGRYPKGSGGHSTGTGTNSTAFKKWFGKSKVVDADGDPVVVYHGTTHDITEFAEAGSDKYNPESDWGAAAYFTSEQDDLDVNYAGEGPDLTSRIEQRADEIESERENNSDTPGGFGRTMVDGRWVEGKERQEAMAQARKELIGGGARSVPAYLSIQNPFVLGMGSDPDSPVRETYLTMESERTDPDDEDSDYEEPTGTLIDFVEALRNESTRFSDTKGVESFIQNVLEQGMDGGISASRLNELWLKTEEVSYISDDTGKMVRGELFRSALERAGFDGVIDRSVFEKFSADSSKHSKYGGGMQGISPDTVHYITFKPTQVKSAIGNKGTFDPNNPLITLGGPGSGRYPKGSGGEQADVPSGVLAAIAQADGGFTYHAVTGEQPTTGYALSIHKTRETVMETSTSVTAALAKYADVNWDLLVKDDNYLGGWHDPDTGKVYLDVSTVVQTPVEAERLCREAKQIAYFDLVKGVSVKIHYRDAQSYASKTDLESHRPQEGSTDLGGYPRVGEAAHRPRSNTRGDSRGTEDPRPPTRLQRLVHLIRTLWDDTTGGVFLRTTGGPGSGRYPKGSGGESVKKPAWDALYLDKPAYQALSKSVNELAAVYKRLQTDGVSHASLLDHPDYERAHRAYEQASAAWELERPGIDAVKKPFEGESDMTLERWAVTQQAALTATINRLEFEGVTDVNAHPDYKMMRERLEAIHTEIFERTEIAAKATQHRIDTVSLRADDIAKEMGVDPSIIHVVDKEPTPFVVGNLEFREGGHFDPNTGQIEINARNSYEGGWSATAGLAAHELTHAMFDTVSKEQEKEHGMISNISGAEYDRLFGENGYPRSEQPEVMKELAERFPASFAFAETWGDRNFGTKQIPLNESEGSYRDMRDVMVTENGHSSYAKAYWAPEALQTQGAIKRAVNETLAEVTRFEVVPDSWIGENKKDAAPTPKSAWLKFSRDLRAAYKIIKTRKREQEGYHPPDARGIKYGEPGYQPVKALGGPGSGRYPKGSGAEGMIDMLSAITHLPAHANARLAESQAASSQLHTEGVSTRSPAWTDSKSEVEAALGDFQAAVAHGHPVEMNIADLSTYQTFVSKERLRELTTIGVDFSKPVGVVFDHGGKHWLVDGNHRTSFGLLQGRSTVKLVKIEHADAPLIRAAQMAMEYEISVLPADLQAVIDGLRVAGGPGSGRYPKGSGGEPRSDSAQALRDMKALELQGERFTAGWTKKREAVAAAWVAWREDTQNRKRPLKLEGAAAKKLDSYKHAQQLDDEASGRWEAERAFEKELQERALSKLEVPEADRSAVVFVRPKQKEDSIYRMMIETRTVANAALETFKKHDGSGAFMPTKFTPEIAKEMRDKFGMDTFYENLDGTFSVATTLHLEPAQGRRAHATIFGIAITNDRDIRSEVYHEVAHHIEMRNEKVLAAAIAFRTSLVEPVEGQATFKLFDRPHKDVSMEETALHGRFYDKYMGKIYPNDMATEIVSTGVTSYLMDPIKMAKEHPEHFSFIYDVLHGKYK